MRVNPLIAGVMEAMIAQYGIFCSACEHLTEHGGCPIASHVVTNAEKCKESGGTCPEYLTRFRVE